MKAKNYFLTFSVICILFYGSCTKDNTNKLENESFYIIGTPILKSLYHKVYLPALVINASSINHVSDSIDLDNDGIRDIMFESFLFKSRGGYSASAQFVALNEKLQIPYKWITETDYECSYKLADTLYKSYYHTDPGLCNNNAVVTIIDRSTDHPRQMVLNDTLFFSSSDKFNWYSLGKGNGSLLASRDSIMRSLENNNSILGYEFENNYSGIWNGAGNKYLAFKIEDNNFLKYGWIKLEILESRNIKIHEIVCFIKEINGD